MTNLSWLLPLISILTCALLLVAMELVVRYAAFLVGRIAGVQDVANFVVNQKKLLKIFTGMSLLLILLGWHLGWLMSVFIGSSVILTIHWWLGKMEKKRKTVFQQQLPDMLDALALALKSGVNLQKAITSACASISAPISTEFRIALSQYKMGQDINLAIANIKDRVDSEEVGLVSSAVAIASRTGGSLADTICVLAKLTREKAKIRAKIDAITAMGKAQGWAVGLSPFAVGAFMFIQEPNAMFRLFSTWYGLVYLSVMLIMIMVAAWLIKKIIAVDV